jgi:carbamoylphosphate synthase small subunit
MRGRRHRFGEVVFNTAMTITGGADRSLLPQQIVVMTQPHIAAIDSGCQCASLVEASWPPLHAALNHTSRLPAISSARIPALDGIDTRAGAGCASGSLE